MWQRIQTLYLFLAIALNAVLFILSFALLSTDVITHELTLYGVDNPEGGAPLYSSTFGVLLCALSMLLSLVIILMFKKRQLQVKLAQLNLVIQLGFVVFMFLIADTAAIELNLGEKVSLEYGVGTYLSIVPLVFLFLAIKAIKKDEALVRSADRIR